MRYFIQCPFNTSSSAKKEPAPTVRANHAVLYPVFQYIIISQEICTRNPLLCNVSAEKLAAWSRAITPLLSWPHLVKQTHDQTNTKLDEIIRSVFSNTIRHLRV
jgi:hypothetical protein